MSRRREVLKVKSSSETDNTADMVTSSALRGDSGNGIFCPDIALDVARMRN